MVEAVLDPAAEPLVEQMAAGGGAVEGLRLTSGWLVLKIACAGAIVQVRLRDTGLFPLAWCAGSPSTPRTDLFHCS